MWVVAVVVMMVSVFVMSAKKVLLAVRLGVLPVVDTVKVAVTVTSVGKY